MKKYIYLIISIFYLTSVLAIEKTKEEKVAKFVLENIQKDYTSCYAFYRIAEESFRKSNAKKSVIRGLVKSADTTLKFVHDLGEVLELKPQLMTEKNRIEIKSEFYKQIISEFKFNKKNVIVIGNLASDIIPAENLNLKSLMIKGSFGFDDHLCQTCDQIDKLKQILNFL